MISNRDRPRERASYRERVARLPVSGFVAIALGVATLVLAGLASAQPGAERSFHSTVTPLSASQKTVLAARYWRPGCPVSLSQLRVLTVRHWGFDGETRTGQLIVNRDVADPLRSVFRRLYQERFAIRHLRLDIYRVGAELPAHGDVSGSFECRQSVPSPCVGGSASGRWSNHAYGHAIDLNPVENPYVGCGRVRDATRERYINRTRLSKGMVTPAVVRAFASIGWGWGGSWTGDTKDYMHFSTTGG